ncbi:hypothetical protein BPNPMPFG_000315 [Mesorhizobium sp. AR07]|uniref:hypothetical protein n=1 Tax=Mesorhizobium sp. AR07 TaxID=2865838 RepID=UPI00215E9DC5|nr:hypothetical protein [Mesorhizobium sp. AR07]UVK44850.1 hypothetical protein BPNPMPFG_000315 [Mesorhizobium sp. AR07]
MAKRLKCHALQARKARAQKRAATRRLKAKAAINTVARVAPSSPFFNPNLARFREGAKSEPPSGPIIRNSGGPITESIWVADTDAE